MTVPQAATLRDWIARAATNVELARGLGEG